MEEGAVVWAKFAHYPYWPSRVVAIDHAPRNTRKSLGNRKDDEELVWFFGSHNYAYVPSALVLPYQDSFDQFSAAKKTASFKTALKEAEKWIKKTPEQKQKEIMKAIKSDSEDSSSSSSEGEEDEEKEKGKTSKTKKEKSDDESESKSTPSKSAKKSKESARSRSASPKKRKKTPTKDESTPKSKNSKVSKDDSAKSLKSEEEKEKASTTVKKIDSGEGIPWTQNEINGGLAAIQRHPISKYYKLKVVSYEKGKCHISAVFSDVRAHCVHEVHSCLGAGYFLLDAACYVALMKDLIEKGHSPLTQGFHSTIKEAIKPGESVDIHAVVKDIKESVGVAFLEVKMTRATTGEELMSANVVKTLVAPIIVTKRASTSPSSNGTVSGEDSTRKDSIDGKELRGLESRTEDKPKTELSPQNDPLPLNLETAMTPS